MTTVAKYPDSTKTSLEQRLHEFFEAPDQEHPAVQVEPRAQALGRGRRFFLGGHLS